MVPANLQAISKKLANQALKESRSNVSTNDSYIALIKDLKENKLPHKEIYGVSGDVTAVLYHDPVIAPENIEFIFILTSDVTHGVFDSKCGYKKFGLWCGIDATKHIKPLGNTFCTQYILVLLYTSLTLHYILCNTVIGVLQHEDVPTFDAMITFLLEIYPSLKTARTITLVDGDQANMNSIQRLLRWSRLMTCLYHISENAKNYISPSGK